MNISKIVTYLILAAIAVLIVTHAGGFSTDVNAVGATGNQTLNILSGSGQSGGVNYPSYGSSSSGVFLA